MLESGRIVTTDQHAEALLAIVNWPLQRESVIFIPLYHAEIKFPVLSWSLD